MPSLPECWNVHVHCWPTTRTVSSDGGSVCFTFTHTFTAITMMMTSKTRMIVCGQLIQRLRWGSLPVMYCDLTPGRARKRHISQKNMPSAAKNQTPVSSVTQSTRLSTSPAYVEALGRWRSITASPGSEDEQEHAGHEQHHADHGEDHGPTGGVERPVLLEAVTGHA